MMARSRMFWKSFVMYVALTALAVIGPAAVATQQVYSRIWEDAKERLEQIALIARGSIQDAFERHDRGELNTILTRTFRDAAAPEIEVTVLDAEGTVLADVPRGREEENAGHWPEIQQASRMAGTGTDRRASVKFGERSLYFASAIRRENELLGFVRIGTPEAPLQA